jgi:hypothetical protein
MIIKGSSRSGPSALAAHLGNTTTNERVTLLETRGTVSQDMRGALIEMDAYALGTRCEKPLYHANIDPQPPHRLTPEQRMAVIDALEEKLGLVGHQRIVVMHEKHGREHLHVVWTRIDLDHMRSVSDSHNYRKHEEVARDLERRFGHDRVQGAHAERDGVDRPDRTPSRAELRQEERTGIRGSDVKNDVTEAFRTSDGPEAFRTALENKDYILAKGDKRDFVIVDRAGGIHSLARRIDGMKAAELREFMKPLDRESLPNIEQAREQMDELQRRKKEARAEANLEKAYSRGDDYVSQTTAALKDHERRQDALDDGPRPDRPEIRDDDRYHDADDRVGAILTADDDKKRSDRQAKEERPNSQSAREGERAASTEITDRMRRLLDRPDDEYENEAERDDDGGRDRQHEVPSGGRTRSR